MSLAAFAAVASPAPAPAPTIKLLIDKKAKRVLFAEARKDVVDFLFGLLAMPVGAVAKLLASDSDGAALGAVANIYTSAEKMDPAYMQSTAMRDALLNTSPVVVHPSVGGFHSLVAMVPGPSSVQGVEPPPPPSPVNGGSPYPAPQIIAVAATPSSRTVFTCCCPSCGAAAGVAYAGGQGAAGAGGFVQGLVTYTIMDDLTITPMSNVSGMALLSKLNKGEKGLVLEEKSVKIGYQEGLDILKASLHSKTVLTDVFLSNKKRARTSSDRNDVVEKEKDKIPDFYV